MLVTRRRLIGAPLVTPKQLKVLSLDLVHHSILPLQTIYTLGNRSVYNQSPLTRVFNPLVTY